MNQHQISLYANKHFRFIKIWLILSEFIAFTQSFGIFTTGTNGVTKDFVQCGHFKSNFDAVGLVNEDIRSDNLYIVRNIQILNNANKYCPPLSKSAQCCPVLFNIVQVTIAAHSCQSCIILRNIQILPNIVKYCLILLGIDSYCIVLTNIVQWCPVCTFSHYSYTSTISSLIWMK